MAYWLVKSEPAVYSWDHLVKEGNTCWSGVRNYAARNNLMNMKKGDALFFYYSNEGLEIVGIAKVIKEYYPDPTTEDKRWVAVDIEPVQKFKKPVTLSMIKGDNQLSEMVLINNSRLSVQPVSRKEWIAVLKLAGEK